jgi:hypothetical protein
MVFGLKPMRVASSFVLRRTFGSWLSKRCCFEAVSISLFFASFSASLGWTQARPSATPDTSPDVSNAAALPVSVRLYSFKSASKTDSIFPRYVFSPRIRRRFGRESRSSYTRTSSRCLGTRALR